MLAGCDDSMLHMPIWTAQVTMHMEWPFKDRLSDTGPAISLLWRPPGKNYHRELFLFLLLLVPAEGDAVVSLRKATGQGLRGCQLGTRKFMWTWGKDKARSRVQR